VSSVVSGVCPVCVQCCVQCAAVQCLSSVCSACVIVVRLPSVQCLCVCVHFFLRLCVSSVVCHQVCVQCVLNVSECQCPCVCVTVSMCVRRAFQPTNALAFGMFSFLVVCFHLVCGILFIYEENAPDSDKEISCSDSSLGKGLELSIHLVCV
jgi:hypothetical protein